nr:FKBP-type peptidyl-prolyl cis-trans isomerase [uncultured Carboxylicivirga sp.]
MRKVVFAKSFIGVAVIALTVFGCSKDDVYDAVKQMEIDRKIIEDYISDNDLNAAEIFIGDKPMGVFYFNHDVADEADTDKPKASSIVEVSYKGYLTNGKVFDQTKEDDTFRYPLNGLIAGWKIGIPLMSKGDKISLIIPSPLAYGNYAMNGIPANSVLVFDIKLHDFSN